MPTPWSHMHINIAVGISEEFAESTNDIVRIFVCARLNSSSFSHIYLYVPCQPCGKRRTECRRKSRTRTPRKTMQYEYNQRIINAHTRMCPTQIQCNSHTMAINIFYKWHVIRDGQRAYSTIRWCCHTAARSRLYFAHGIQSKIDPTAVESRVRIRHKTLANHFNNSHINSFHSISFHWSALSVSLSSVHCH